MKKGLKMRALERSDLRFIHELNNNRNIMAYWFEEPYEPMTNSKNFTVNTFTMTQNDALSLKTLTAF